MVFADLIGKERESMKPKACHIAQLFHLYMGKLSVKWEPQNKNSWQHTREQTAFETRRSFASIDAEEGKDGFVRFTEQNLHW